MKYGVSLISVIPCRSEPSDRAEQVTQLLFGEHYKVLEERAKWVRIRCSFDNYEAWLDRKQHSEITEREYKSLEKARHCNVALELVSPLKCEGRESMIPVVMGSTFPQTKDGAFSLAEKKFHYEGTFVQKPDKDKRLIVENSLMYENAPYLWGGRSPFGIDCSGLVQIVYKLNGIKLPRDASMQAQIGVTLSFVEEADPGDLAFFDNEEGEITHVGILLDNNHIIHASGQVRIDRIDHQGIFNPELRTYSHKLRLIKRIF